MTEWDNFFIAIAGAAATLTGLIFVGVSISLARILSIPRLPGRASQALILLLTILITSSLCLVPHQPTLYIGVEFLVIGIIVWCISLRIDIGMLQKTAPEYKKHSIQNMVFTQLSVLPYIISGMIIIYQGFNGIYWLIPGIIFSFIKAVIDAWVLLVEINR
jgi:hypothetical protein